VLLLSKLALLLQPGFWNLPFSHFVGKYLKKAAIFLGLTDRKKPTEG
jgi:hypothetical protein